MYTHDVCIKQPAVKHSLWFLIQMFIYIYIYLFTLSIYLSGYPSLIYLFIHLSIYPKSNIRE